MKQFFLVFLLGLLLCACKQGVFKDTVFFDTNFKGARLDSVQKVGENLFRALVLPENEPINQSPWFAFGVKAVDERTIHLTMDYGNYQHRYIPKISTDKRSWKPIEASKVVVDTLNHTATFELDVSTNNLYVAAQEIITSEDTYRWMENYIGEKYHTTLQVAGKTVLDQDNYVMVHETQNIDNSIVLIARQHPPEIPGGTIGFQNFYETLFSNSETAQEFRENFNIYTFPLLNPDGVDAGNWRHNANGVDLNRDWVKFSQPETQAVRDFVANRVSEGKKIRFALDFHTSYSGPYLLVLDSIHEAKTKKTIPDWIEKIEANSNLIVYPRRRSQQLPYCYNFFYNTYGAESVTYEDGDEISRDTIMERGRTYAHWLMETLLEKLNENQFDE